MTGLVLTDEVVLPERDVILEELHLQLDEPDDLVHTELAAALFPGHPLGWEILGTEASIGAATLSWAAAARSMGAAASMKTSTSALRSRIETTSLSGTAVAAWASSSSPDRPACSCGSLISNLRSELRRSRRLDVAVGGRLPTGSGDEPLPPEAWGYAGQRVTATGPLRSGARAAGPR